MSTLVISGFENGKSPGGIEFDTLQDTGAVTSLDTVTKQTGTQSLKVLTSATQTYVAKAINTGVVSGVVCFALSGAPTPTHNIVLGFGPTNTPRVAITTALKMRCDIGGNTGTVSTTVLSANTFYYAAYRFDTSGTTFTVDIKLYNAAGSLLETLTQKTLAAQTQANMTSLRVGQVNANAACTTWIDNPRATDQSGDHPLTPGGVWSPLITDTGNTFTETLIRTKVPVMSDTGTTFTESLVSGRQPVLSDTGTTLTETPNLRVSRSLVETATSFSASLQRNLAPTIVDTGSSFSDVLRRISSVLLSDTATTFSEILARLSKFSLVDDAASPTSTDGMQDSPEDGSMGSDEQGNDWLVTSSTGVTFAKGSGAAVVTVPTGTGNGLNGKFLIDVLVKDGIWSIDYVVPTTPVGTGTNIDVLILDTGANGYRVRANWTTTNGLFLSVSRSVNGVATQIANANLGTPTPGATYRLKAMRRGAVISANHFLASSLEPAWILTPTDATPVLVPGNPGFRVSAGATTVGMDYTFTNWNLSVGINDGGVSSVYKTLSPNLRDYGVAVSIPRRPPLAGAGVVTGLGIRGIPNNNIFAPDRFSDQGSVDPLGVYPADLRPRLTHTLYPFTASDTSPGTVGGTGRTAIGQDEQWLIRYGAIPIVNIGGLLAGEAFTDFPLYDSVNFGTLGMRAITAGTYDSVIDGWARGLASLPSDVFVRLWREPVHGHPWWTPDPADYIAAYRYVVGRLRQTCHNLFFIFCVGTAGWWLLDGTAGPSQSAMAYYPGDDVTDYIGGDGYEHVIQNAKFGWDSSDFYTHFKGGPANPKGTSWYDWGLSVNKPMIICENGAWPDPLQVQDLKWINSIVPGLKRLPEIRMFCTWSGLRYPVTTTDGAPAAIQAAWESVFADPYMRGQPTADSLSIFLSKRAIAGLVQLLSATGERQVRLDVEGSPNPTRPAIDATYMRNFPGSMRRRARPGNGGFPR